MLELVRMIGLQIDVDLSHLDEHQQKLMRNMLHDVRDVFSQTYFPQLQMLAGVILLLKLLEFSLAFWSQLLTRLQSGYICAPRGLAKKQK